MGASTNGAESEQSETAQYTATGVRRHHASPVADHHHLITQIYNQKYIEAHVRKLTIIVHIITTCASNTRSTYTTINNQ